MILYLISNTISLTALFVLLPIVFKFRADLGLLCSCCLFFLFFVQGILKLLLPSPISSLLSGFWIDLVFLAYFLYQTHLDVLTFLVPIIEGLIFAFDLIFPFIEALGYITFIDNCKDYLIEQISEKENVMKGIIIGGCGILFVLSIALLYPKLINSSIFCLTLFGFLILGIGISVYMNLNSEKPFMFDWFLLFFFATIHFYQLLELVAAQPQTNQQPFKIDLSTFNPLEWSQLTYPTFGDLLQPFISLLSMNVILHFFGRYLSISVIFKNLLSTESIDFNQENNQENKGSYLYWILPFLKPICFLAYVEILYRSSANYWNPYFSFCQYLTVILVLCLYCKSVSNSE